MAEELLINIIGDASKLKTELDKASGGITGFATKAAAAGRGLTIAGGLITAAFGLTVKAAIGFNKEIANIATLIPGSTERVNELKSAIRTMAVEVGKDTTDLAQGAYQVISAFGDTADTVAILGIAAKAATAGVATTTDAIDLLSAVTKGYGDTSKEAVQKASDLAFQTVTLGQTTFPELATSIGKVIPLTSELGVSQEELFAVMATGTGVTGKAAEVSTQLRGIMQSLMSPTADMTKLLAEKEYASGKAMLADLGLAGALDVIKNAAEASNAPLQKYISSIEGQTLALALTGTQADTYISKLASMRDSVGLTGVAFKEQTEGVNAAGFAFGRAKIQITTLAQEIGDMLLPMLTPLINKVTEIVGKIREWAETHKPLVETIVKWGAGLGVALAFLGPILIMLPSIIVALGLLKTAFIPFLIGGAIIYGLKKLSEYLGDIKERAFEAYTGFKEWPLDVLNTKISEMKETIADLETGLEEIDKPIKIFGIELKKQDANIDRLKQVIKDYKIELGLLEEQQKKLTEAEKEGIDVTEELTEIDKAMAAQQESLNKVLGDYARGLKDIPGEIEEVLKGSALLSAQMSLLKTEYENSNKTLEDTQEYYESMVGLLGEYIKQLGIEIKKEKESTPVWFAKNEELSKAVGLYEEVKEAIEEFNRVQDLQLTGLELTKAKLELLELRYTEIEKDAGYYGEKLKLLREEHELLVKNLDDVIKKFGEGTEEYYKVQAAIIAIENEMKRWWKEIDEGGETVDEFAQSFADKMLMMKVAAEGFKPPDIKPWEDFFDSLKDECLTTTEILIEGLRQFWSDFKDALSDAITSFLTMKETNAQILEDMAEAEANYFDELADLQEDYQQIVSDGIKEIAKEKEDYYEDVAEAEANCLKKVAKLQKDYNKIVSDGIKKLAREKEDYYDDLVDLERRYNRKVSDGIKDLARENEDYDIDMRRLTEERDRAAMAGGDKRAEYYQEKMEDCTLAHTRAVEDMKKNQKELTEDHNIKLAKMEKEHKETMNEMMAKKDEETQNALDKIKEVKDDHEELLIKMEKEHREAMEALIAKKDEEAANALQKIEDVKEDHADLMEDMQGDMVTTQSIAETFWGAVKTAAINALADMIVKQVISAFASFCASIPLGWLIFIAGIAGVIALAYSYAAKNLGGEVKEMGKSLGGAVKMAKGGLARFAMGGLGTDTVLTMLTPGEYVIAKPMTDFIKRFRIIPESLTEAITRGAPTPVPAFAGGGLVGNQNVTSSSFGETRIYIDIHDNRISDKIDIKRLAITVGDEMTRRLNARRRY